MKILPNQSIDGASQKVDLIVEWKIVEKIVDAKWFEIFAKSNLTKVFRIYMKFDSAKHEVRGKDEEFTVEWRAGAPSLSIAASKFQGQMTSVEFGAAYAFTEELKPGVVYNYRFSKGIAFRKL